MTEAPDPNSPQGALDLDALLKEGAWVRRLARSLVADESSAEDLTQEVMIAAFVKAPRVKGLLLRGWLGTVTRRLSNHTATRNGNRVQAERRAARPEAEGLQAQERLRLHHLLGSSIESLPESCRVVLALRYFEDLTAPEIAERLDITPAAARKRISRGLALLREQLDWDSEGGRAVWISAFAPLILPRHLPPIGVEATASLPLLTSLLLVTKTKPVIAIAAICLCGLLWLTSPLEHLSRDRSVLDGQEASAALTMPLGDEVAQGMDSLLADATVSLPGERAAVAVAPLGPRIRVTGPGGVLPPSTRVAWLDTRSRLHAIELGEDGTAVRPTNSQFAHFFAHAPTAGSPFAMATGGPEGEDVMLALTPGFALRGRVIEDGGTPRQSLPLAVTGYQVDPLKDLGASEWPIRESLQELGAYPLRGAGGYRDPELLWTEPDGTFTIDWFPRGTGGGILLPLTHELLEGGEGRNFGVAFTVDQGELIIESRSLPAVRGRFAWADTGLPVRGKFQPYFGFTTTRSLSGGWLQLAADGSFAIGMPRQGETLPGEEKRAYRVVSLSLNARHLEAGQGVSRYFSREIDLVTEPLPLDLGVIPIERVQSIHVRIVDTNGKPIHGAAVASYVDFALSDTEGAVEVSYIPSKFRDDMKLHVLAEGYSTKVVDVPAASIGSPEPLQVKLTEGVRFTVLTDPSMSSRALLELRWYEVNPFEGSSRSEDGKDETYPWAVHENLLGMDTRRFSSGASYHEPDEYNRELIQAPESGRLAIPGLRPGSTIWMRRFDLLERSLISHKVTLPAAGESLELDLRNAPKTFGNLTVTLVDADGTPIQGGTVVVNPERHFNYTIKPKSPPESIGPFKPGTYDLLASADGYLPKEIHEYELTEESIPLVVQLDKARKLEVHCVDDLGNPISPTFLRLVSQDGWSKDALHPNAVLSGLYLISGDTSFPDVPLVRLTLEGRVGIDDFYYEVGASEEHVTVVFPRHEAVTFTLARELWRKNPRAALRVEITARDGGGEQSFETQCPSEARRIATIKYRLRPGLYSLVLFTAGEDPDNQAVFRGEFEVEAGKALQLSPSE